MGTSGSVAHFFQMVGLITVPKDRRSFDEVMEAAINAGATDLEEVGNVIDIYTNHSDLHKVKEALVESGVAVSSFELYYKPTTMISIADVAVAKNVLNLLTNLEEIDDVQRVYANIDIPDELLKG